MNELTPIEEAIKELKEKKNMFQKATKSHSDIRGTYQIAIFVLESLLHKEKKVIEEFKNQKEMYKECFETFIPIDKWDEATLFLSTYGNGLAKELSKKEK